jgi:cytochrome P450
MPDLVGQTFSMLMTGYEPMSSALSSIVYLITAHPEVETKLLKELKANEGLEPRPCSAAEWPFAMVRLLTIFLISS